MTKAHGFQPNLAGGEFSPRMEARVDFDKYATAISRAKNMICLPQGGMTLAPGTRFLGLGMGDSTLVGFRPAADQSYMLEFYDGRMRIWKNQGRMSASDHGASISNGTFDSNITGWSDESTGDGAISHTGSALRLGTVNEGTSAAEATVTIPVADTAKLLTLEFTLSGYSQNVDVSIGTTSGAEDVFVSRNYGPGHHIVSFTPGATTVYLRFTHRGRHLCDVDDVAFLDDEALELVAPWTAAEMKEAAVAQKNDVMYVFHEDHRPRRIERRGDASWSIIEVHTTGGPWLEINPGTDLVDRNLVRDPSFDAGIQDWTSAEANGGYVDYDASQKVVFFRKRSSGTSGSYARITNDYTTTDASALHVMHFQIVGSDAVSLSVSSSGGGSLISANYKAGWYTVSFTPGDTTFTVQFEGGEWSEFANGVGGVFIYSQYSRLIKASSTTDNTVTLTALGHSPFTSGDVGRLIRLEYPGREPAWGVITAYSSGTSVSAYMYRRPPVAEYTESWRFGAWCDAVGWPSVGTFFQQRLFAASSQTYPQKVWGSQTDDFENMAPDSFVEGALTAEDNDALDFTLAGEEASKIYWMAGQREFLLGTGAGIYRISSRGAVLTPQDFNAELQVVMKLADVQPIKINDTAVFVTKSKRRLYDVGYKYEVDGYQAAELSVFSDHLATTAIEEIVYQSDPVPLIWARLNGGRLVCYTYNRQQQVIGGTPRVMAGTSSVNSIGVIPGQTSAGQVYRSDDRDEVWLLVEREINGSTLYCVEVMEGMYQGPARGIFQSHSTYETNQKSDQVDAFYVESGLTYIGSPAATVTGLGHLNGETVKIVVNGAPHTDKVVSGGSVALDFTPSGASMTVHVGLGYDWAIRTLKLPYGARAGSGVVAPKQTYQLGLILLDSSNFEYAVEYDREMGAWREHVFRRTDMELGEAVPLFTGEVGPFTLECGTSTDPRIHLKGDAPLPFTLLGFVPSVDTHEQK